MQELIGASLSRDRRMGRPLSSTRKSMDAFKVMSRDLKMQGLTSLSSQIYLVLCFETRRYSETDS